MKAKPSIIIVLLILLSQQASSQRFLKSFGKVGKEEFELRESPVNKDAPAVVLFDVGKSEFARIVDEFNIIFQRTTRIKVFADGGADYANISIPYYQEGNNSEQIIEIEAVSYNYENNTITTSRLDPINIYTERLSSNWLAKKFAIPGVRPGSIIEYRYKIISPYTFNFRDWEFQWRIPVLYSEYEVALIPFYKYSWFLQGASKFDSTLSYVDKGLERQYGRINYQDKIHKYIMKNVTAFESEEFLTSINDYIIKLDFQLAYIHYSNGRTKKIITTWKEMISEYLSHEDFGGFINRSQRLMQKQNEIDLGGPLSQEEKFNRIPDFVKANFQWNGQTGRFANKSPQKLLQDKTGNAAEINLFTIGLLRSAGIKAEPVLISTRNHGRIKYDYPFTHFFNYVIVLANIEGKNMLADATETNAINSRIAERCLNDKGLIVEKNKVEWIDLSFALPAEQTTMVTFDVLSAVAYQASLEQTSTEYFALAMRNKYNNDSKTLIDFLNSHDYIVDEQSVSLVNKTDRDKPWQVDYTVNGQPEIISGKIYLSPFLNQVISENPLKQQTRRYPVDLTYPRRHVFVSRFTIPEGYTIDFLPEEQIINNQMFELRYNRTVNGSDVEISFEYFFKRAVYPPGDYGSIRFFFNEIVKRGKEKVVLSKSS